MKQITDRNGVPKAASAIAAEIKALDVRNTPNMRAIRRTYSRALRPQKPDVLLRLAGKLLNTGRYRWFAYELIRNHQAAFRRLDGPALEALGRGINSWWTVDAFARTLSGPAWLDRRVPDRTIRRWARSKDRWWRRAALVSTVALNVRTDGGTGDVPRTLRICRLLADDRDDMVVKAMSWALRALAVQDPRSVRRFLKEYDGGLAARVKREVRNKLHTGLKNPERKKF
jgi:3-methyladenine DNA glycosylase AlkD